MDEKQLGRGLTTLRRSRGLALQDVALQTALPVGEIVRYEQGGGGWEVQRLLRVLDALGSSLDELKMAAEARETLTLRERLKRAAEDIRRLAEEASQVESASHPPSRQLSGES